MSFWILLFLNLNLVLKVQDIVKKCLGYYGKCLLFFQNIFFLEIQNSVVLYVGLPLQRFEKFVIHL